MQKLYLKKVIDLKNELKELISVSVDESINYKMEQQGMRAFGSILINGEYKNSTLKKAFQDSIDIDILAQYAKIEDRNDFVVKVEDFDYYINEGNLSLVIEAYVYGVKDDDDRIIETQKEEFEDINQQVEELMRMDDEMINTLQSESAAVTSLKEVKRPIIETIQEDKDQEDDLGTYYLYVVREGDTYRSIATHYMIEDHLIRTYNHERSLEKGTIVIIPYS